MPNAEPRRILDYAVIDAVVNDTAYSEPIPMEKYNRVLLEALLVSASGTWTSGSVQIWPQYTNDLSVDWVDDDDAGANGLNLGSTSSAPPRRGQQAFGGPTAGGKYRFTRIKVVSPSSARVLVIVDGTFFTQDS